VYVNSPAVKIVNTEGETREMTGAGGSAGGSLAEAPPDPPATLLLPPQLSRENTPTPNVPSNAPFKMERRDNLKEGMGLSKAKRPPLQHEDLEFRRHYVPQRH
jgi:hypothetical protein